MKNYETDGVIEEKPGEQRKGHGEREKERCLASGLAVLLLSGRPPFVAQYYIMLFLAPHLCFIALVMTQGAKKHTDKPLTSWLQSALLQTSKDNN